MTKTPRNTCCRRARLFALAAMLAVYGSTTLADAPLKDRFFNASDGVRLHYLEGGRGHTLVFVPGWTMPAEIWHPQLRYFASNFHVVAFDPRAQGDSEIAPSGYDVDRRARDIKELLDQLHADPVVLIGWSLAVLESLTYVKLFGTDALAGLVLVDNSVGEQPPPSFDPTFLTRLRTDRLATTESFVHDMYRTPQSQSYYQHIISRALKTPTNAAVALLSDPHPRSLWREIVYSVDKPLLYVVTSRYQEQAQNLKRHKPTVQIDVFADAGHALFVDDATRFNAVLADFARHSFATVRSQ
jgi:non-heme chloroperoxidase